MIVIGKPKQEVLYFLTILVSKHSPKNQDLLANHCQVTTLKSSTLQQAFNVKRMKWEQFM
jgi:hypothetical protein